MGEDPTASDAADPRAAVAIALRLGVCPKCGKQLTDTDRYGSGSLDDGIFCSLSCFSTYRYGKT